MVAATRSGIAHRSHWEPHEGCTGIGERGRRAPSIAWGHGGNRWHRVCRSIVRSAAALIAVVCATSTSDAQSLTTARAPWILVGSTPSEYLANVDKVVKRSGVSSAHVAARVRETSGYVALSQSFRADAYRGRRLAISVYRRTRNLSGGGSYLYVSITGVASADAAYANSMSCATKGTTADWVRDTVSVLVPANANWISFGNVVDGAGDVWIDDVDVRVVDAPIAVVLNDAGFESTERFAGQVSRDVFARLTGYVRFFSPSDASVATNWANFETSGIAQAERAPTTDSLVHTLCRLFASVAPDIKVYATNDPQSPLRVDLGAGVSAVIPSALRMRLPSDRAKLVEIAPIARSPRLSINDRSVRLAAVIDLWMTMEHFYPYFDISKTDWAREVRTGLARAAIDSLSSQFDITIKRMVASLHDGHGNVYRGQQFTGVLPVLLRWVTGQVIIASVKDTAATSARRGDIVLAIDGTPVDQLLSEQESLISRAFGRAHRCSDSRGDDHCGISQFERRFSTRDATRQNCRIASGSDVRRYGSHQRRGRRVGASHAASGDGDCLRLARLSVVQHTDLIATTRRCGDSERSL